ncbi:hypothetical protein NZD89_06425 [Alicyclobacillus fastidiosus]|uniref:Uncharacterized protein n=1 Tax=Alicyclobacillus fastidiosus TaxID=392011 RepID=A0ABY6ZLH0_9BACL|nr:hypothetical protein [Alicyclobacillus fastidiosus]WAH43041.1 hypothetical protein NZD89_06425 [Alicyclobacillus fastidiosus]GMA65021.1 hypothetical protein GCM10025859_54610 [Alicyclobacillus fastidiosus]
MGPEMMSWFTDMETETAVWIGIGSAMIIGTFFGLWYWDRFLNQLHENENLRDNSTK